jgi:5-methylcytosine-specific restriction endonuclease McrA
VKGGEIVQTLVLNVGYQPVARVPWETAIVWVLDRIVEVVDEYPDRHIRTITWTVHMPSVVRFLRATPRKKAIKFSRHNVYARDRGRCQYCGLKVRRDEFTYDHVIPRMVGGRTCWENVVVACVPCNQKKAGRTPEESRMTLRSTPVKPKKLPDIPREMQFTPGMPESWKAWLRSAVYWDGALETD